MRAAGRLLTAMALWSLASPAHGHETRLAFLEVRALGAGDFVSVLKIPVTGATAWPIEVRLPATCAPRGPDRRSRQADSLVVEQRFSCDVSGGAPVMGLAGLAGGFVDVLVRVEDEDGNRLTRVASGALTEIPLSPGSAGAWDRLVLGLEHILGGVDHLLFVAGMILLVRGWRRLVTTITAFTVAHSITLGMTVLDVVRVPGPPVEAFIALSIEPLAKSVFGRVLPEAAGRARSADGTQRSQDGSDRHRRRGAGDAGVHGACLPVMRASTREEMRRISFTSRSSSRLFSIHSRYRPSSSSVSFKPTVFPRALRVQWWYGP